MSEYKVNLQWLPKEGEPYWRMARLDSPGDRLPEVICVTPPEFKKGIPQYWSPEHLFVSSVVGCFFTTFLAMSESSSLPLLKFRIEATGILEKDKDGKSAITKIDLFPEITIEKEADKGKVEKLVEKVEANCLISNSMKSTVLVHAKVLLSKKK